MKAAHREVQRKREFIKALGWGVSNGEEKLETCTTGCPRGLQGSGSGEFSDPAGLAFSGGNRYVSDLNNGRIEEFSTAGAYIAQIGSKGAGNGQLSYPAGIGVDAAGNLYVADSGNNRIEEFTLQGFFVGTSGSTGSGNGQFRRAR